MENQKKPFNDIAVVASSEENSGRETDVAEDEVRTPVFGTDSDENLHLAIEAPLARPTPSDRPYDISPLTESDDGIGMGMVDQSDEKTMAEYERGAKEDAKRRTA